MNIGNKLVFILLLFSCAPTTTSQKSKDPASGKKLYLKNFIYEPNIRTVQLYEDNGGPEPTLRPAVVPLQQNFPLILEFDDLVREVDSYYAKVIHCNANWERSLLRDLEYMDQYNEFNITDYAYSVGTRTEYVHYTFELPHVTLPGNYILLVYRNNPSDMILTRRFMVYQNRVQLSTQNHLIGLLSTKKFNQQIEFVIDYKDYEIDNPLQDLTVNIRQNQRWDNAIFNLEPSFIKTDQKIIEYRHFDAQNNFKAWNEFRFFDLRSLRFYGQNVESVEIAQTAVTAKIMEDHPRTGRAYAQFEDLNGMYLIQNNDAPTPDVSSEYIEVNFNLKTNPVSGEVFLIGALNDWQTNHSMTYDSSALSYTSSLLLKQGWYDYMYLVNSDTLDTNYFEGSHYQTENEYEIFIYHKPFSSLADLLVGYYPLGLNRRN